MPENQTQRYRDDRKPQKPGYEIALIGSLVWLLAGLLLFVLDELLMLVLLGVLVVVLLVAGAVWRPMRAGDSPSVTALVPLWGLVARWDRIRTCERLRRARILNDSDPTVTIPATTWHADGDTFVRFDGAGRQGMGPEHIAKLLGEECRVWKCRSFAVSEDEDNPGLYTMQLSRADHVTTELDRPLVGVLDDAADRKRLGR